MKKTTIEINGKPFIYNDEIEDITYENSSEISVQDARNILDITKRLFKECNIFFFIAFGTLLGAVREHGLIKGDEDVDVFIFNEDKLRQSLPYLYEHGLYVCRIYPGLLYSFRNGNKSYIDVYILKRNVHGIWKYWCVNFGEKYYPLRFLSHFEEIEFLGGYYNAPTNPERILEIWYGKSWRTPIKGHGLWESEVHSHYWWRTKGKFKYESIKNKLKKIIKNVLGKKS